MLCEGKIHFKMKYCCYFCPIEQRWHFVKKIIHTHSFCKSLYWKSVQMYATWMQPKKIIFSPLKNVQMRFHLKTKYITLNNVLLLRTGDWIHGWAQSKRQELVSTEEGSDWTELCLVPIPYTPNILLDPNVSALFSVPQQHKIYPCTVFSCFLWCIPNKRRLCVKESN